jgi:hypothetical protein
MMIVLLHWARFMKSMSGRPLFAGAGGAAKFRCSPAALQAAGWNFQVKGNNNNAT